MLLKFWSTIFKKGFLIFLVFEIKCIEASPLIDSYEGMCMYTHAHIKWEQHEKEEEDEE